MTTLTLFSPLAGWATPLDDVPDPVFSERMVGDGVAIDPIGNTLHAPCAGKILPAQAGSRHAVRLGTASGEVILMHIGIETVGLRGEGFELLVKDDEQVAVGQPLLRFDLDLVARQAKSSLTPVLITSGQVPMRAVSGKRLDVGDYLMEVAAKSQRNRLATMLTGWLGKSTRKDGISK